VSRVAVPLRDDFHILVFPLSSYFSFHTMKLLLLVVNDRLKLFDPPEHPLKLAVSYSRLVLRDHMTALESLDPHQTSLVVLRKTISSGKVSYSGRSADLYTHDPLSSVVVS